MRKTLKVAEVLESRIRNGGLIPPTQKIAMDFDVSYKTAYQAVTELVDRKVAYRIKGKGAFALYNNLSVKAKTFAMLWGSEEEHERSQASIIFKEILMGVNFQSGLEKLSIRHLIYNEKIKDDLSDVDFVLSWPGVWSDPVKQKLLEEIKQPHLYLGFWHPPIHICSSLCLDTALSFKKALEYLVGLGRKNIGIVHHDENKFSGRNRIFADIKKHMRLPHCKKWEIFSGKHTSFESAFETGVKLGNAIIKNFPEIDGVVCVSDHVAAGIYSIIRKNGHNLAVMGMDNIEGIGYCPLGEPMLTCIDSDYCEMGRQAVKILINMPTKRSVTYLESKIKIRKSCGE